MLCKSAFRTLFCHSEDQKAKRKIKKTSSALGLNVREQRSARKSSGLGRICGARGPRGSAYRVGSGGFEDGSLWCPLPGPPQGSLAGTTFPGRATSQEVESFVLVSPCETSAPWFPCRLLESRGTSQRGRWGLCLFLALLEHSWCPRTQQDLLLARPEVLSRMGGGGTPLPVGPGVLGLTLGYGQREDGGFQTFEASEPFSQTKSYQNKPPRRSCSGPGPPTLRPPQRREGKPCMSPGGQRGGAILRLPSPTQGAPFLPLP